MLRQDYLTPLKGEPKRKPFVVVDIESKDEDTQKGGFTRPFLVGVYDGAEYQEFANEPHLRGRDWRRRHDSPGGCVDKALNYLLSDSFVGRNVYAHNGGNFDHLFWLAWLRDRKEEFDFEIVPVQSSIQKLVVVRRPDPGARAQELPEERKRKRGSVKDELRKRKKELPTWTFLDSMKLFPTSLSVMLDAFGLGGKEDHDLDRHEDDPSWSKYLRRDCVGLYEALERMHDLIEKDPKEGGLGGEVGLTAPATAMKLFRRRFLGQGGTPYAVPRHLHWQDCPTRHKREVAEDDCHGCVHDFLRPGYAGGRTEVFCSHSCFAPLDVWNCVLCGSSLREKKLYEWTEDPNQERAHAPNPGRLPRSLTLPWWHHGESLNYYDVNSSYVATMRDTMPAGDRYVEHRPQGIDWKRNERFVGFAKCVVEIPEDCALPPLPYRHPELKKLVFPVGRFSGIWDVDELALLHHPAVNGSVVHVERVVWFRRKHLFREMVQTLWPLRDQRREGYDKGLSALAKLMGNSTYGKFGMQPERVQIVFRRAVEKGFCFLCGKDAEGGLCKKCDGSTPLNGDPESEIWYQNKRVDAPYIIPQIAMHITAGARIRLWRCGMKALELGGKLFYMDTDSVLTDVELPTGQNLGELKNEYPDRRLAGLFVGAKAYMIRAIDGQPLKKAHWNMELRRWEDGPSKVTLKGFPKEVRTKETLENLSKGAKVKFERLAKVRSMAQKGFAEPPWMVTVEKTFRSVYDKRTMHADGSTSPLVVREEAF